MEKIYMEENNKQQQQKKSVVDFSVVLSFAVAFFAILSLTMVGIGNIQGENVSYAAPDTSGFTGDTFTFHRLEAGTLTNVYGIVEGGSVTESTQTFGVPMLFSDSENKHSIFCVEKLSPIPSEADQATYKKNGTDSDINDYGLLYILNNSMVNGKKILSGITTLENDTGANIWATQVAIWLYLSEVNSNASPHTITAEQLNVIQNVKKFVYPGNASGVSGDGVYAKIRTLVDNAKAVSNSKVLSVTKADGEISKSNDGSFYQSTLFTVTGNPSSDFKSYDIVLSGVEGAYAVDEEGNNLTLTGVTPGKKFYVRVPADKLTQTKQDLKVTVTGHFDSLAGSYYVAADGTAKQKVVSVTGAVKDVSAGASIEVVGAPDTGMNSVQTIYFIGLIVLLCGVGIVYANAKPVESKQ